MHGIRKMSRGKGRVESGEVLKYQRDGAGLRKEVMPMVQFLLNVAANVLAGVLAAFIIRHFDE